MLLVRDRRDFDEVLTVLTPVLTVLTPVLTGS